MRRLLLFAILGLTLTACKEQAAEGTGAAQNAASQPVTGAPQPPPNTREAQLLLRDYWVFEYYIVPDDPATSQSYRGKWYKFNPDGTFTGGHWRDFQTKGTWALKYGYEFPLLLIQAENAALNGEFQMQSISETTEYMSWVGTARFGQKGHAAKVMNLLSEPTRKQFGLE